jgi:4-hydroxybenzoate polyprenyltransferase
MSGQSGALGKLKIIFEMIKFEHTIFALPFALISVLLAARHAGLPHGIPSLRIMFWVIVAMVGARSAA